MACRAGIVIGKLIQLGSPVERGIQTQGEQELLARFGMEGAIPVELQFATLVCGTDGTTDVEIRCVDTQPAAKGIWLANKAVCIARESGRQVRVVDDA